MHGFLRKNDLNSHVIFIPINYPHAFTVSFNQESYPILQDFKTIATFLETQSQDPQPWELDILPPGGGLLSTDSRFNLGSDPSCSWIIWVAIPQGIMLLCKFIDSVTTFTGNINCIWQVLMPFTLLCGGATFSCGDSAGYTHNEGSSARQLSTEPLPSVGRRVRCDCLSSGFMSCRLHITCCACSTSRLASVSPTQRPVSSMTSLEGTLYFCEDTKVKSRRKVTEMKWSLRKRLRMKSI